MSPFFRVLRESQGPKTSCRSTSCLTFVPSPSATVTVRLNPLSGTSTAKLVGLLVLCGRPVHYKSGRYSSQNRIWNSEELLSWLKKNFHSGAADSVPSSAEVINAELKHGALHGNSQDTQCSQDKSEGELADSSVEVFVSDSIESQPGLSDKKSPEII